MIAEVEKRSQRYLERLLHLIYPLKCLICQEEMEPGPPRGLCPNCFNKIQRNFSSSSSGPTSETKYYFNQIYSACSYQGIIKESIQLLKYKGKLILIEQLSRIMIEFARENKVFTGIDYLGFVPLHRTRLKEREFNQSRLLALKLSRHFEVPLLDNLLKRVRPTPSQTNLSKEERFKSLREVFAARENEEIKGKIILLVDDVFTTGATLNECAKVLREAGVKQVGGFTLARG